MLPLLVSKIRLNLHYPYHRQFLRSTFHWLTKNRLMQFSSYWTLPCFMPELYSVMTPKEVLGYSLLQVIPVNLELLALYFGISLLEPHIGFEPITSAIGRYLN